MFVATIVRPTQFEKNAFFERVQHRVVRTRNRIAVWLETKIVEVRHFCEEHKEDTT